MSWIVSRIGIFGTALVGFYGAVALYYIISPVWKRIASAVHFWRSIDGE